MIPSLPTRHDQIGLIKKDGTACRCYARFPKRDGLPRRHPPALCANRLRHQSN